MPWQDLFQHLLALPLDDYRVIYAEACIQKARLSIDDQLTDASFFAQDLDRVFPHCFGQTRAEPLAKQKKWQSDMWKFGSEIWKFTGHMLDRRQCIINRPDSGGL